jgi:hypothetical protein
MSLTQVQRYYAKLFSIDAGVVLTVVIQILESTSKVIISDFFMRNVLSMKKMLKRS